MLHCLSSTLTGQVIATGDEDLRIMARTNFETFPEFQPDSETITAYLERENEYFAATDIGTDK